MKKENALRNLILSILLTLCILSMFLTWFGGSRGVSEIKGTVVLNNLITISCIALAIVGIRINNRKMGRKLATIGFLGICIMEVYYFLAWHIETISGSFDLATSFSLAFPEFYVGLGMAGALLIMGFVFFRMERD